MAIVYQGPTIFLGKNVTDPLTYNYITGIVIGIVESTLLCSFRRLSIQIFVACVGFALKILSIEEKMYFDDNISWIIQLFVLFLIGCFVQDNLERQNFRMIYESKQKLEKFQTLLSNDFPTSVLIMNIDFTSILYSNQFFCQRFDPIRSYNNISEKDFILYLFKKIQLEDLPNAITSSNKNSLFDFLQKISSGMVSIQMDEVIVLSATFNCKDDNNNNDNDNVQHYEIRLRKILWEEKPCYTIILNDISDKQLVTALKYADDQKERVIATVSHELRTPINGILGLLEMAGLQINDQVAQTYLKHCKSCSKLLLYLVNSILDLSLLRQNKLHIVKNMFNLNELIEEMRSLYLFQTQQKGIKFIVERQGDIPEEIYTDKFRLIEILINLFSNAFKFTFKGSIKLTISIDDDKPDKMKFSIADTGLGIKEKDKPNLFQMFGTIKQENKNINSHGAGLGLTIANNLVKALNDESEEEKMELQSEYQKGSIFSFRISYIKQKIRRNSSFISFDDNFEQKLAIFDEFTPKDSHIFTKLDHQSSRSISPFMNRYEGLTERNLSNQKLFFKSQILSDRPKRVLIVDDNPFNLLTACFLIEKQGLETNKAMSGEQCIDLLQQSALEKKHYDIILMDIQMPI